MANLDNLLGSHLSLISQQDVRYDGILFSINAKESSIVLRDGEYCTIYISLILTDSFSLFLNSVKCLGTEDRVAEESKKVAANPVVLAFVTFPGHEIKDLYVHESTPAAPIESATPPPAPTTSEAKPRNPPQPPTKSAPNKSQSGGPPQQKPQSPRAPRQREPREQRDSREPREPRDETAGDKGPPRQQQQRQPRQHQFEKPEKSASTTPQNQTQSKRENQPPRTNTNTTPASAVGTGEHLLRLRVKKVEGVDHQTVKADGEFDFEAALSSFNKTEVLATVAGDDQAKTATKYKKDDFFDSLSCELVDRAEGRSARLNPADERALNQDTFGAVALQPSSFRRGGGGGYRGGGRGGGRGRGRGGGGEGGRRSGRGGGRNSSHHAPPSVATTA